MAEDKSIHMFKRMNQDLSFDKRDPHHYWEAMNMELINNGDSLSMVSTSGTELKINILNVSEDLSDPDNYSLFYDGVNYNFFRPDLPVNPNVVVHQNMTIIGLSSLRDDLYIFVQTEHNLNIIFRYNDNGIVIVFAGYLGMTIDNPLEILPNYENTEVQKLYWVDGKNWFRILNVAEANAETLETLDPLLIDTAIPVSMSNPTITSQDSGGSIPAGRRQYAYSLYNRSGQQSLLSQLSTIYSISETNKKGGEEDELMSVALNVTIDGIDTNFDSIIIYAIHYNSDITIPEITVILDEGITDSTFTFRDDGNLFVSNFSYDAFIALNNATYIGGTINVKKNVLFMADYSVDYFDIDFDARAYSYNDANVANLVDSEGLNPISIVGSNYNEIDALPEYDSVNADESIYKYQVNGTTTGGTGRYVSYKHVSETLDLTEVKSKSYLKRGDKYRIGIVFRDKYNRSSPVSWVADTRIPYGASGKGYSIELTLNNAGQEIARSAGAVGYSVVMVERTPSNRDILAQGFITPTCKALDNFGTPVAGDGAWRPYYITKDITTGFGGNISKAYDDDYDFEATERELLKKDEYCALYSPDITLNAGNNMDATHINIVGFSTIDSFDCNTLYELWNGLTYGNGRNHLFLKFRKDGVDGGSEYPFAIDNDPTSNREVPLSYMSGSDHDFNDDKASFQTYFSKPYDFVSYKLNDIESIPLKESSTFVQSDEQIIIDESEAFINDFKVSNFTGKTSNPGVTYTHNTSSSKLLPTVALVFDSPDWHKDTIDWDKFIDMTGQPTNLRAIPVVDLKAGLINQYGGNSFEARRRNGYVEISDYTEFDDIADVSVTTSTGDVFMNYSTMVRSSGENNTTTWDWGTYEYIRIGLETYVDTSNVYDDSNNIFDNNGLPTFDGGTLRSIRQDDWSKYNFAYGRQPNALTVIPKDYNFQSVVKFDTNIIASGFKFNNELIDSWSNFLPNETMQLDSKYGKITKLQELQGELYAFQPRAIASLSILPKVSIQASDGINLEMGTGDVLDDYQYITTRSGSLNKFSIYSLNDDIYYYDYYNKSISSIKKGTMTVKYNVYKLISDYHNLNPEIINDNPLTRQAVLTTYDTNKKNLYFTFQGTNPLTISYNPIAEGFVSLHSMYPTLGAEYNGALISTNANNRLYESIHEFDNTINRTIYDNSFASYITILSSNDPLQHKTFGNVEYDVKGIQTFNRMEVWNDYQTTGEVNLVEGRFTNMRRLYNKWRVSIGREENTRNVIADTKAWVKMIHDPVFDNEQANPISNIVLNNIEIKYTK